jgi:methionyl-tRNA formyltransferase
MNIAYFGSPSISALLLKRLLDNSDISSKIPLIITQPDKPAGKRLEIQPTPVKNLALERKIHYFDKELSTNQNSLIDELKDKHIELCIVFAYGEYIKNEILDFPKYGFWNVHPSLLPLYRGPSPIAYPLLLGDTHTGTSLIKLTNVMDGGPIIMQEKTEILNSELRSDLEMRLTELSVDMVVTAVNSLSQSGSVSSTSQEDNKATMTRLLTKQDGFVELNILKKIITNNPIQFEELPLLIKEYATKYSVAKFLDLQEDPNKILYNYYCAMHPWPGLWTMIPTNQGIKRLKLNAMNFYDNIVTIEKVQLEGKKEVQFSEFNKAYSIFR